MTRRVVPSWGHSGGLVAALAVSVFVFALTITAGASGGSASRAALADCTTAQLRLSGRLTGATQSLLCSLVLTNRSERACALPAAPRLSGTRPRMSLTSESGIARCRARLRQPLDELDQP